MTRELKIALLIGFCLVLVVSVLIADHLSAARSAKLAEATGENMPLVHDPLDAVAEVTPGNGIQPGPLALTPTEPATVASATQPTAPDAYSMVGAVAIKDPIAPTSVTPQTTTPSDAPFTLVQGQGRSGIDPNTINTPSVDPSFAKVVADEGARLIDGTLELPTAMRTQLGTNSVNPEPVVVPPTAVETYTVKSGDNLYKIAKAKYGSGEKWRILADANKDKISKNGNLKVGTVLKVPAAKPVSVAQTPLGTSKVDRALVPGRTAKTTIVDPRREDAKVIGAKAEPKPVAKATTYTVKPGDSLSMISKATLGTSRRVDDILAANRGLLDDEDTIRVGMVLKIPAK